MSNPLECEYEITSRYCEGTRVGRSTFVMLWCGIPYQLSTVYYVGKWPTVLVTSNRPLDNFTTVRIPLRGPRLLPEVSEAYRQLFAGFRPTCPRCKRKVYWLKYVPLREYYGRCCPACVKEFMRQYD